MINVSLNDICDSAWNVQHNNEWNRNGCINQQQINYIKTECTNI